ncbi:MAG: hypothetical protein LBM95_08085 [Lactobacillales bacterium]|nr:hypothetical protein [Lactobacillales bacterium]
MGFKIISDRDKDGNFIASSDAWTPERIEKLLDFYYPKRIEKRKQHEAMEQAEKKEKQENS